jgi:phosphoribosylanthranilate isomerase
MLPLTAAALLKVCGLRDAANLAAVAALHPDFMGFIFHAASPRYAGVLAPAAVQALPLSIRRVGVFVDETTTNILALAQSFGLHVVQLHGHETPAQCTALRAGGLQVIKAFEVGETLDIEPLKPYATCCDYFLFDTQGPAPGGNGRAFDWQLLRTYDLPVPYLLAGGIGPAHAAELARLRLPGLAGFDLNSRFETAPGLKDAASLQLFFAAQRPLL